MDFVAHGDLDHRLRLNYDRLERGEYTPATVFATIQQSEWPGDYVGRLILALVHLARTTGRRPLYLETLLAELPEHLNARGYLGDILPDGIFDEQQFSGHGWLVAGLLEYHGWTQDPAALNLARTVVEHLFLPARGHFRNYAVPARVGTEGEPAGHLTGTTLNGWRLSSDVGCAFIALEGMVAALRWLDSPELRELVEEAAARFLTLDVRAVSAQTHATLTVARNLLGVHDTTGATPLLEGVGRLYALYRAEATTENYANYNWFNRPAWTEPCAIVDALIVAFGLWRRTGDASFLEDAHNIYYNALGYAQKPHGGFGCDCCAGPAGDYLYNQVFDVIWCCNMRGAIGLSHVAALGVIQDEQTLILPFPLPGEARCTMHGRSARLTVETTYPASGSTTIRLDATARELFDRINYFVPSWIAKDSIQIAANGVNQDVLWRGSFVSTATAAEIRIGFSTEFRAEPPLRPAGEAASQRYRQGPLLLAEITTDDPATAARSTTGGTRSLVPLRDVIYLTEARAQTDRRRLLFPPETPGSC